MTRPKKSKAPRRTVEPEARQKHSELMSEDRKAKLGVKHVCFSCGTRFYDMNKPEPICPKCKSDQREKPKVTETAPPPPPKKAQPRPMPLLEDDDSEAVPFEEDVELEVGGLESGADLFGDAETDTVEGAEEDTEEP